MGNCPQGVYFGPGDSESTEFVLDELGEQHQMDRQQMVAMSHSGRGKSPRCQSQDTYKEEDKTPITSGFLRNFEPGKCIVISRTTWWHGHSYELHKVRDSLPENGAESSATLQVEGSDDDGLEEYDSWLSLARSKVPNGQSDDDDKGDTASTGDCGDETADEAELDSDVWTADTNATPDISFLDHKWERALTRLDVQDPPITEKKISTQSTTLRQCLTTESAWFRRQPKRTKPGFC